MEIVIQPDAERTGDLVARKIMRLVKSKPDAVLGLATGSSPLATYRSIRRRFAAGEASFRSVTVYTLDEYVGLPADHPESYRTVIRNELTDHLDFTPGSVHTPDVHVPDLDAGAYVYDGLIGRGVDLQLLGIGENGHIGFNEPGSSLVSRTRVVDLSLSTREANARFFEDDIAKVPTQAVTQGLGTIVSARHIVLLAQGAKKARAIAQMAEGPVSAFCPASVLQLHPYVTVFVDDEAAAMLQLATDYRAANEGIPTWREI